MFKSWQQYAAKELWTVLLSGDFTFMKNEDFPAVDLLSQYVANGISTVLVLGGFSFIQNEDFSVSVDLLSHVVLERQYFVHFCPLNHNLNKLQ